MTPTTLTGWLGLGLLTGAGCLVGCGGLLLPYLVSCGESARWSFGRLGEFLAGRLAAYLLVGVPAVLLGGRLQAWPGLPRLAGAATLALAILLLVHAWREVAAEPRPCAGCHGHRARVPLAAGFALGLTPCAPLLLALGTLLTAGRLGNGLAFLAGFAVSTTFWLLPVLAAGRMGQRERWRGVAQVVVMVAGLWYLVRGWTLLTGG